MQNSQTVDLSNWSFSFGGSDPRLAGIAGFQVPEIVRLATPIDLLLHLANHLIWDPETQIQIQQRLKKDPIAMEWHRQRPTINSNPHFKQYRENRHYEQYHAAAAAVSAGNASREQENLVRGLDEEIATTALAVPAGQVLFHGRGDQTLHTSSPYPSFISTSLDPLVCVPHAIKRKNQNDPQARAYVYVLTLREPLHAIWGNGGKFNEWELLLQRRLRCGQTVVHQGSRFDVIETTVLHRNSWKWAF